MENSICVYMCVVCMCGMCMMCVYCMCVPWGGRVYDVCALYVCTVCVVCICVCVCRLRVLRAVCPSLAGFLWVSLNGWQA